MLSDCRPCVEAGAICRTDPARAGELHKECRIRKCPCAHKIPEKP